MARRIQRLPWNQIRVGHAILAGRVPRIKWAQSHSFDNMMMQCASSELIAQAFTQKQLHQNLSVILFLQNLYCQGKVMRNVHLNTEYVVLFHNP